MSFRRFSLLSWTWAATSRQRRAGLGQLRGKRRRVPTRWSWSSPGSPTVTRSSKLRAWNSCWSKRWGRTGRMCLFSWTWRSSLGRPGSWFGSLTAFTWSCRSPRQSLSSFGKLLDQSGNNFHWCPSAQIASRLARFTRSFQSKRKQGPSKSRSC